MRRRVWQRISRRAQPLVLDRAPSLSEIVRMLETGERGRVDFERLWAARLLDGVLPEWEVVRGLPQLAPFHEHPVDIHLWRTVSEMSVLVSTPGHYQRVAEELDDHELLYLASFLHDIGKGQGRPHAEAGAEITASLCRRLGVSASRTDDLVHAVLHHLLLAETATRRDLDDPAVIYEIAEAVGSVRRLQVLYLLTVADSRATGPTMWSEWKGLLLRTLFMRVALCLEDGRVTGTNSEQVVGAAGEERVAVEDHIAGMPEDYLLTASAEDVLWHLDAIGRRVGPSLVDVRPGRPADTAVVVGDASPFFRRHVARSFAANGIDVLEAKLSTRSDGLAVDTFHVRHDRTGGQIGEQRWEQVRLDIDAAVVGELDAVSKVAERAAAYESEVVPERKPTVDCSIDPATGEVVVVVKCTNRIGRLAEILGAIGECGLDVRLAKLDSRGEELVDTFHVRSDADQHHDPDSVEGLSRRIAAGITP